MRVDKDRKVWETLGIHAASEETAKYPHELVPGARFYYIYYRK